MAGRKALVRQHLEGVSRRVLEEHQQIVRQYVRRRQGVYALFRRGKLYYVGLASNLRMRLAHHLKDRHKDSWDSFSIYLTIGDSHLRELESLILRIAAPSGNKQKGRFAKSEDLHRRFRRDLHHELSETISGLFVHTKPSRQSSARRKKAAPENEPASDGRSPVLARYSNRPSKLRGRHKGKTIWAHVRKAGAIYLDKQHFNSPSLAARHAVKRPTCNGWHFWQYQLSPGNWVPLDNLRQ